MLLDDTPDTHDPTLHFLDSHSMFMLCLVYLLMYVSMMF